MSPKLHIFITGYFYFYVFDHTVIFFFLIADPELLVFFHAEYIDNMINIMTNHPFIYYGAVFLELALVFLASGAARKNTPSALPLFLFYSALNGFTLSFIIVAYTQTTVLQAFVSSALVFGVMSVLGFVIKKDLSGFAKAALAALIGIIIASFVNIFIGSGMMSFVISIISVLIFSGLIAYDNQMIKRVYEA